MSEIAGAAILLFLAPRVNRGNRPIKPLPWVSSASRYHRRQSRFVRAGMAAAREATRACSSSSYWSGWITRLRNCAVARSVGRAMESTSWPAGEMQKRGSVCTPTILPSLTRISKAERGRGKGSHSSLTRVISVCPTCKRQDLSSHRTVLPWTISTGWASIPGRSWSEFAWR